ncbi:MAG: C40 family peptidase [Bacteroidales bacterium]|nr:C40 family peptidase [Bacteroidales bacterium]
MKKLVLLATLPVVALYGCCGGEKTTKEAAAFETISKEMKAQYAPDGRSKTLEVKLEQTANGYALKGVTNQPEAKAAYVKAFEDKGIKVLDSIAMLPSEKLDGKIYGVSNQSVINFRTSGKYSAESATQVMMGTPLQILEKKDGWTRAITPEGYISWVSSGSITYMDKAEFDAYQAAKKVIVTTKYATMYEGPSASSQMVSDVVWGNILLDKGAQGAWQKVAISDGREGYVLKSDVTDFNKWLDSRNPTAENIIATAKQFIGVPYMWGGTSIKAVDCSGFCKSTYFLNGIVLARDASQQCLTGDGVDISKYVDGGEYTREALANLKKGDLIFFGTKATPEKKERITHVGIYIEDGIFIHSATKVRINSLIPTDENYYDGSKRLVRAQRILGNVDAGTDIWSLQTFYK